MTTNEDF